MRMRAEIEAQEYWYLQYFKQYCEASTDAEKQLYLEEMDLHLSLWLIYGGGKEEIKELNLIISN